MSSHVRYRIKGLRQLAGGWTAAEPRGGATPPEGAVTAPRDPGALSGPLAGISFVAGVVGALSLTDSPYPRPGTEPADVRRYFQENPGAARISVVGQLISAASLARFTASVAKLAARSDRGARGLRTAAIAGGTLAAASRRQSSEKRSSFQGSALLL